MLTLHELDRIEELDRFVARFEQAHARGCAANVAEFLPAAAHPLYSEVLQELLRIDLEYGWASGHRKSLENYAQQFPEFFKSPENVQAVAFEEYRLRLQHGDEPNAEEYETRFAIDSGNWPAPAKSRSATAHRSRICPGSPRMSGKRSATNVHGILDQLPTVGTRFLGFRLLAELGRGAFGTVFLAAQDDLAERPVALKVSCELFGESQTLAQLQHTHIVPIYSVHRAGGLQAICMPYFGPTTLADVFSRWKGSANAPLPQSGKAFADTVADRLSLTVRQQSHQHPRVELAGVERWHDLGSTPAIAGWSSLSAMSYVEAVLSIGMRLADGLAHAHDRGVLHRDLKPANVLLANDGQPMLLDFNLAADLHSRSSTSTAGGTLPYMSPEQLAGLSDDGRAIDARSDVYGLGVILYQMLAGKLPYPARHGALDDVVARMIDDRATAPAALPAINPVVSAATNAIVQRCLCSDPAQRYQSAAELRDDLTRQLTSLPLRYAREPSLRERAQKWMRRHPKVTSATSVTLVAAALVLALVSMLMVRSGQLATIDARDQFAKFEDDFRSAQILALDAAVDGTDRCAEVVARGEQALDRFDIVSDSNWQQTRVVRRLSGADQQRLSRDADELRMLIAAVRGQPRPPELVSSPQSIRDECAVACWYSLERRFREALPHWQAATTADPQNVWAWYGLACCYDQLGQEAHAIAGYTACIAIKPQFADWYFRRGVAYLKQRDFELADADFSRALQWQADRKELLIDRALARMGLQRYAAAIADLTAALKSDGNNARAYLMLAQVQEKSGDVVSAQACRQRGLRCVPADDRAWVAHGVAHMANDFTAALASFDRALECNTHCLSALESKAHVLAEKLGRVDDAIAVLTRAIELYPEQAKLLAARGVLLGRLKSPDAARRDAKRALALDSSDAVCYQVAGIYALLNDESSADRSRAIELLTSALQHGFGTDLIGTDPDLDSLREEPAFQRLIGAAQTLTNSTKLMTAEQ